MKKHRSCTVHVTRSRAPIPSQYMLHGQVLESVGGSKYQSVEISSILSFINHIQSITTSASRSLGFLRRNNRIQNPVLREMAYKIPVCPSVEYSLTLRELDVIRFPRVILPKALILQDECIGKNYSSHLDFTRNYGRKSGIFVPWGSLDFNNPHSISCPTGKGGGGGGVKKTPELYCTFYQV